MLTRFKIFLFSSGVAACLFLSACSTLPHKAQRPIDDAEIPNQQTGSPRVYNEHASYQVSYQSVLELPVTQPDEIIPYGNNSAKSADQSVWFYKAEKAESDSFNESEAEKIIIFIHGGCWLSEFDIGHTQAFSHALAREGYNVWNIEYRRSGNGGEWPVALEDIKAAVRKMLQVKPMSVNAQQVVIAGHSAGGHLAMLLAGSFVDDVKAFAFSSRTQIRVMGLAPIVDIAAYAEGENSCQMSTSAFMRGTFEQRQEDYHQASPLNIRYPEGFAYVFIGGQDKIVPENYAIHPDAEQHIVLQAGHFDWIHPHTQAFKSFLAQLSTAQPDR
uniref:alpha/beta hydrolase n=1 Tax=Ningiella ruwaisensis TaxID=2364274 RepID=UPI00144878B9|nr:alpha/beta hydrolase [Ningiella ruwaisensis]